MIYAAILVLALSATVTGHTLARLDIADVEYATHLRIEWSWARFLEREAARLAEERAAKHFAMQKAMWAKLGAYHRLMIRKSDRPLYDKLVACG